MLGRQYGQVVSPKAGECGGTVVEFEPMEMEYLKAMFYYTPYLISNVGDTVCGATLCPCLVENGCSIHFSDRPCVRVRMKIWGA